MNLSDPRLVCKHGQPIQVSDCPRCQAEATGLPGDAVSHPHHYTSHPSGIECIQITEHMGFCLGNAIKYIWRAGLKTNDPVKDLEKAIWYLRREIERLRKK